jgi:hypothetical protein
MGEGGSTATFLSIGLTVATFCESSSSMFARAYMAPYNAE